MHILISLFLFLFLSFFYYRNSIIIILLIFTYYFNSPTKEAISNYLPKIC